MRPGEWALASVSDKRELDGFVRVLNKGFGVTTITSGGTYRFLKEAGVPGIMEISSTTGAPEMLDGLVKTIHPKIAGAIMADRENPAHMQTCEERGIHLIGMVIVTLYDFTEAVRAPDATPKSVNQKIDIGGNLLLRAAVKGHRHVTVICDPDDYDRVLADMRANNGCTTLELRSELACKAIRLTAKTDAAIATYLESQMEMTPDEEVQERLRHR